MAAECVARGVAKLPNVSANLDCGSFKWGCLRRYDRGVGAQSEMIQ